MKRFVDFTAVVLAAGIGMQAADAMPRGHVSACLARQRADLAPLDRYGGVLPAFAPALMQQIMNPALHEIRTRCLPLAHDDAQAGWDYNSPTIVPH